VPGRFAVNALRLQRAGVDALPVPAGGERGIGDVLPSGADFRGGRLLPLRPAALRVAPGAHHLVELAVDQADLAGRRNASL
jgi:hypothetical protein